MIISPFKKTNPFTEIAYNKLVLLFSLPVMGIAYIYPQYSCGPIAWSWLLITYLIFVVVMFCCAGPFAVLFVAPVFYSLKVAGEDFFNYLFLINSTENIFLSSPLTHIKNYFIAHPALAGLYTGLIFILLVWQHPEPYEKRCAFNPLKITDCLKENKRIRIGTILLIAAYFLMNKYVATAVVWGLVFYLFKFFPVGKNATEESARKLWGANGTIILVLSVYLLIFGSYAVLGVDKEPAKALMDIILMNP